jgi:ABC-type lipoprotein release transport system permease subunit
MTMATVLKMARRNIGRNRRRTLLTVTTVTMVVLILIFMQSYVSGIIGQIFDLSARLSTGHLKVYPKGYENKEALLPIDLGVADSESVARAAAEVPGTIAVSRRIRFFTMVQNGDRDEFPVLMGIEPKPERLILELDQSIARGRYFEDGPREAILGIGLAQKLGIVRSLSDPFTPGSGKVQILAPRGIPMTFTVVGLARFGYGLMDDKMMFVRFADAQYAADMDADDMATEVVVMLDDRNRSLAALAPMRAAVGRVLSPDSFEVLPWQSQGWIYNLARTAYVAFGLILAILFFVAASTVVNTMMMAVMERTRELGMLLALGMKGREIVGLVLAEAAAIGAAGGLAGALLGVIICLILEQTGIPLGESMKSLPMPIGETIRVEFFWWFAPVGFGFGLLMTVLASLWPALKAAKLSPTQALRTP